MTTSLVRRLQHSLTKGHGLMLLAVFLVVLGSRLWLVQNYGNDVPVGDQWDAEATKLYKPMHEHAFGTIDWFAAHNEHRIVLTRITAVAMLLVNGQWDPLLQESWEAICAALIATLLCVSAIRLMPGDRAVGLVFGLALIGLTMPYGWENALQGFQNQFYYLMLIALAMFHLCAYRGLLTFRRSVLIAMLGLLSLGTLASGALACSAAACALVVRLAFARQADTRRVVGLVVAMVALTLVGFGTTPTVAGHAALHAHDLAHLVKVFNIVLGWPSRFGCLVWIPFIAWSLQSVFRRRIDTAGLFVVGLAAFVLLNALATASARGAIITDAASLASRYTDIAWYAWVVNLIAALLLAQNGTKERSTTGWRLAAMLVFCIAGVALWNAGFAGLAGAAQRGAYYETMATNTRTYVTTGNTAALRDKGPGEVPYPNPVRLMQMIDDPTIRALLPPGIRQGIIARSGGPEESLASQGLLRAGAPSGTMPPPPHLGDVFGTWGTDGNGHTVKFVSAPIEAQGSKVRTLVSGYLGRPGLSLYVEDIASGKRADLVPDRVQPTLWTSVSATIPGPTYRLVAEDTATGDGGWFAFTDPIETGVLRRLVEFGLRSGKAITLLGLALFLTSMLGGLPRPGPTPHDA